MMGLIIQPILKPITAEEPQKVAAAMRQSLENARMMSKLLQRIKVSRYQLLVSKFVKLTYRSLKSLSYTGNWSACTGSA